MSLKHCTGMWQNWKLETCFSTAVIWKNYIYMLQKAVTNLSWIRGGLIISALINESLER